MKTWHVFFKTSHPDCKEAAMFLDAPDAEAARKFTNEITTGLAYEVKECAGKCRDHCEPGNRYFYVVFVAFIGTGPVYTSAAFRTEKGHFLNMGQIVATQAKGAVVFNVMEFASEADFKTFTARPVLSPVKGVGN